VNSDEVHRYVDEHDDPQGLYDAPGDVHHEGPQRGDEQRGYEVGRIEHGGLNYATEGEEQESDERHEVASYCFTVPRHTYTD